MGIYCYINHIISQFSWNYLRLIFLDILLKITHTDTVYCFSFVTALSALFAGLIVVHETFAKPSPRQKSLMKYELGIGVDTHGGIMISL